MSELEGLRDAFVGETVGRLDAIESGLRSGEADSAALAREAHSLAGAARVLGLEEAAALAERLERELERADPAPALELAARIRGLVGAPPDAAPALAPTGEDDAPAVLYIEDSPANAMLVERHLRRRPGVRMLAAESGAAGLELALGASPLLVLVDLRLPDMGGEEVVRGLRENPATADIPIAVVSGAVEDEQIERLRAAGVRTFLEKPFDAEHLLAVVDRALAGREMPA